MVASGLPVADLGAAFLSLATGLTWQTGKGGSGGHYFTSRHFRLIPGYRAQFLGSGIPWAAAAAANLARFFVTQIFEAGGEGGTEAPGRHG